jgi:hypothetical protein
MLRSTPLIYEIKFWMKRTLFNQVLEQKLSERRLISTFYDKEQFQQSNI